MQVINTNVMSLNAQRNLATSGSQLATSLQRLSSGLRINSAKDDAAGLAISERFTTQIRGMDQAARNANDGISLSQTAEGAMGEISNNLQRIRELAVQSRNATNSASDRAALNGEAQQLKAEIDRVAGNTSFNGVKLLDGSFQSQVFQVGANQGETISIDDIVNAATASLGSWTSVDGPATVAGAAPVGAGGSSAVNGTATLTAADLGAPTNADGFNYDAFTIDVNGSTVNVAATSGATSVAEGNTALLANIKAAIDGEGITGLTIDDSVADTLSFDNTGAAISITDTSGELGGDISIAAQTAAVPNSFTALGAGAFTINGTDITVGAAADAATRLSDLTAAINAQTDTTGVTASVVSGALSLTSSADIVVGGSDSAAVTAQTGLTSGTTAIVAGTAQTGFASLDISSADGADNAMKAMDAALTAISTARASMGAVQNRFTSVVANLSTTSENLSAARSRIQDADFAKETAQLTRVQILQQAGTAMLAQANQAPQNVLSLLR